MTAAAIRSDDPEALAKLQAKLAATEAAFHRSKGPQRRKLDAERRRIENRIEQLQELAAKPKPTPIERGDFRVSWDAEASRVVIESPRDKNAERRKAQAYAMKARGFRWAPSRKRYQRLATEEAWHSARRVVEGLTPGLSWAPAREAPATSTAVPARPARGKARTLSATRVAQRDVKVGAKGKARRTPTPAGAADLGAHVQASALNAALSRNPLAINPDETGPLEVAKFEPPPHLRTDLTLLWGLTFRANLYWLTKKPTITRQLLLWDQVRSAGRKAGHAGPRPNVENDAARAVEALGATGRAFVELWLRYFWLGVTEARLGLAPSAAQISASEPPPARVLRLEEAVLGAFANAAAAEHGLARAKAYLTAIDGSTPSLMDYKLREAFRTLKERGLIARAAGGYIARDQQQAQVLDDVLSAALVAGTPAKLAKPAKGAKGRSPQVAERDAKVGARGTARRASTPPIAGVITEQELNAIYQQIKAGTITLHEYRTGFARLMASQAEMLAGWNALSKQQLAPRASPAELAKVTKADLVARKWRVRVEIFVLHEPGDSYVIDLSQFGAKRKTLEARTADFVEAMTAAELARLNAARIAYNATKAAEEADRKARLADPHTLRDFRDLAAEIGERNLTAEQRRTFEALQAEEALEAAARRKGPREIAVPVLELGWHIVPTWHFRQQVETWTVRKETRGKDIPRDEFAKLNAAARALGGKWERFTKTDGDKKAIAGFLFFHEVTAQKFLEALGGATVDNADEAARRQQRAEAGRAENLAELAERTRAGAEASLGQERKTNTYKRSTEAFHQEQRARGALGLADSLERVSGEIAAGRAKYLRGVGHRTQVETLDRILTATQWTLKRRATDAKRDGLSELAGVRREYFAPGDGVPELAVDDVDAAEYPWPHFHAGVLAGIARDVEKKPGAMRLAGRVQKLAASLRRATGSESITLTTPAEIELVQDLARKAPRSRLAGDLEDYTRVQAMGLVTLPMLRAALREYLGCCKGTAPKEDPIRAQERALVGRTFPGYFPTPRELAAEVVDLADLGDGQRVLEPSAGKGDLAEAIRRDAPGCELVVFELQHDLREVLIAKGFTLGGRDFLEATPETIGTFDRIVANPPFEAEADVDHVRHMWTLLRPGGRIVSIMGEGPFFHRTRKAEAFRAWLEELGGTSVQNEAGAFLSSDRPTGVASRIVVINKRRDRDEVMAMARVVTETLNRQQMVLGAFVEPTPVRAALRDIADFIRRTGAEALPAGDAADEKIAPWALRTIAELVEQGRMALVSRRKYDKHVRWDDIYEVPTSMQETHALALRCAKILEAGAERSPEEDEERDRRRVALTRWGRWGGDQEWPERKAPAGVGPRGRVALRHFDDHDTGAGSNAGTVVRLEEARGRAVVETDDGQVERWRLADIEPAAAAKARAVLAGKPAKGRRGLPASRVTQRTGKTGARRSRPDGVPSDIFAGNAFIADARRAAANSPGPDPLTLHRQPVQSRMATTPAAAAKATAKTAAKTAKDAERTAARAAKDAERLAGVEARAKSKAARDEAHAAKLEAKAIAKAAKDAAKDAAKASRDAAKAAAKAAKSKPARAAKQASPEQEQAARDLCGARVAERAARKAAGRTERTALALTRQHGKALERLQAARCKADCKAGCKACKRKECMARPQVRELAQQLQAAQAAHAAAVRRHADAAQLLAAAGIEVAPLGAPRAPKERTGAPPRSPKCGTVCHIQVREGICGGQAAILLPSAQGSPREVPTRYCMIEADQLITSHDPVTFDADPRYPAATQERRYDRDRAEQGKVIGIAQNPRPELIFSTSASPLDGTPIATPDGIVLGGNGRSMGIRLHYARDGEVFRNYLLKVCSEFGFTPAQVRRFRVPVVVRTVDPPRSEWPRYVRDLNQGLTQAMDVLAEGVSLARQMPPEALEALANGLAGDTELGEFFGSRASLPFIHALERGGIVTAQNRGRLVRSSDGLLTEEGRTLAIRQIGASVLPDADLLELAGPELRQALARSAPFWLSAAAHGGEWDIRPPLMRAVRDLLAARASNLNLRRFFQQADFFQPPHTHQHPIALRMLVLLDNLGGKPAVFSRVARFFAGEADMYSGRQASLLVPKTPVVALDDAGAQAKLDLPAELRGLA